MAGIDRTDDLFRAASVHVSAGVRPDSSAPKEGRKTRTTTDDVKEFNQAASGILKNIQLTSKRLSRLTALTRKQGTYDESAKEINSLAMQLKHDTTLNKNELDALEIFLNQRIRKKNENMDSSAHYSSMVSSMKVQLAREFQDFKSILEKRHNSLQKKSDRRSLFGQSRLAAFEGQPESLSTESQRFHHGNSSNFNVGSRHEPKAGGVLNPRDLNAPTNSMSNIQHSAHEFSDDEAEHVVLIQASETLQNDSYLSSREEAMKLIEGHIAELGQAFSQLASMISQSAHSIERIDGNVQDTLVNMEMGTLQLEQTWQSVQGNRWLAFKIMLILAFFFMMFVVFFV